MSPAGRLIIRSLLTLITKLNNMAILIQEQKKSVNWFAIIVTAFAVGAIVFGLYYLFFAPTPGIEVVVPPPLQSAKRISTIEVDPTIVLNSRAFRSLRAYAGIVTAGATGRDNPFVAF